ncbi:MAG: hypothetical protein WCK51_12595 [Armatimonadota bacterium]
MNQRAVIHLGSFGLEAWRNTDKLGGRRAIGSGGWSLVDARLLPT